MNLNSIVAHITDLCNMIDSINPDIIVGVETKIHADSSIYTGHFFRVGRVRGNKKYFIFGLKLQDDLNSLEQWESDWQTWLSTLKSGR